MTTESAIDAQISLYINEKKTTFKHQLSTTAKIEIGDITLLTSLCLNVKLFPK